MFRRVLMGIVVSLALLSGASVGQQVSLEELADRINREGHDRPTGQRRVREYQEQQAALALHFDELADTGGLFPDADWMAGEIPEDNDAAVRALIDTAMATDLDGLMGESRQIVVIHKGRLVAEAYRDGFTPETKLVSWSMAKSITHGLVGRAVQQGLIESIDAPMPSPWEGSDPRAAITWRHWLTMTDGLDYQEIGEADLAKNDVVQLLYGRGRHDVRAYVRDLELAHEPGTHWNYSTAGLTMVGAALLGPVDGRDHPQRAQRIDWQPGEKAKVMSDWMQESLFAPLGMDAQPEFDAAGTYLGGSLIYASARDYARFGYLYLRDGMWKGTRLLPESWVGFARTQTPGTNSNIYGAGWWLTAPEGEAPSHPQAATSPPYDAFHAGGNEGQTIWVVPSRDLVIVRLGLMHNTLENWSALYEWNQKVARAFPDK